MTLAKDSIYDLINPPKTVMKQHFVDYFQNSDFPSYVWDTDSVLGTATFTMDNGANSGLKISTDTTNGCEGWINFNDVKPFAITTGCVNISVIKRADSSMWVYSGLSNEVTDRSKGFFVRIPSSGYYLLEYGEGSMLQSNSSVATDTNWHVHKLERTSTAITLSIDGVNETTVTSGLNTSTTGQPRFGASNETTAVKNGHIRYIEAYNT